MQGVDVLLFDPPADVVNEEGAFDRVVAVDERVLLGVWLLTNLRKKRQKVIDLRNIKIRKRLGDEEEFEFNIPLGVLYRILESRNHGLIESYGKLLI